MLYWQRLSKCRSSGISFIFPLLLFCISLSPTSFLFSPAAMKKRPDFGQHTQTAKSAANRKRTLWFSLQKFELSVTRPSRQKECYRRRSAAAAADEKNSEEENFLSRSFWTRSGLHTQRGMRQKRRVLTVSKLKNLKLKPLRLLFASVRAAWYIILWLKLKNSKHFALKI